VNLNDLHEKADRLGYTFDALLRVDDGYVAVLVDHLGGELSFKGKDTQDAIDKAVEGLNRAIEAATL
tara:strand:+ start:672 stop:872 length:201 start_codon:yes stop_codon:yes gene_type:complete